MPTLLTTCDVVMEQLTHITKRHNIDCNYMYTHIYFFFYIYILCIYTYIARCFIVRIGTHGVYVATCQLLLLGRHDSRHELSISLRESQGPILSEAIYQVGEGKQKRQRHHRGHRQRDEIQSESHVVGSMSFTPTPRRVWM